MNVDGQIDAPERSPSSARASRPTPNEASSRRLRRRRDQREQYSRVLLVAAMIGSAMGLGGLHWAALLPSAMCALAAGFFAVRSVPGRGAYAPALVPVGLSIFTLLQLVPLPVSVLRVLSPQMAGVWEGALSPFGDDPRHWGSLTADPHATLVEALKWLSYGGALAAAIAAGARRGVRFGAMAIFWCAVVVGATTLAHGLANFQRVYGVYVPTFNPTRWHVGPFLNPNNLAGYLNLGMFSGIGLMLSRKPGLPRSVMGTAVASLFAVVVLGASRAGLASLVLGLVAFSAFLIYVRRDAGIVGSLSPLKLLLGFGGVVCGAVALAWLGSSYETWRALLDKNVEKIDVMRKVAPLVSDHPLFGVGRGAFESVFPAYHYGGANVVYAHPENFVVQWVSEWGIPVGLLALALFAWVLYGAFRDAKTSITGAGVFCGLLALLLQNLLDLGLELPGIAYAALTALGVLWGHAQRTVIEGSRRRESGARALAWAAIVGGGAIAACVAVVARTNVTKERIRLHELISKTHFRNPEELAETRARLRTAMLDHPADPYFPRAGGVLAWYARENPIPWMSRALERGMEIGQTHFALAKVLASLGAKEQALLELRLAATYAPGLGTPAAKVVLSLTHDYDEIQQAVPEGALGARLLSTVALSVRRTEEPELRLRCLADAVEHYPEGVLARAALAEDLSAALAANSPLICGGDRAASCEQLVLEQVAAIEKLEPASPTALLTKAQFWMYTGRAADAEMLLRRGCQRFISQAFVQCQRKRVYAAGLTRSRELLDVASRDLAGAGCGSGSACGEVYAFLGSQAESLGDASHALSYYKRAVAEDPNDVRWRSVARTALAVGDNAVATNALAQLTRRNPDDSEARRRLEDQRRRVFLNGAPPVQ